MASVVHIIIFQILIFSETCDVWNGDEPKHTWNYAWNIVKRQQLQLWWCESLRFHSTNLTKTNYVCKYFFPISTQQQQQQQLIITIAHK